MRVPLALRLAARELRAGTRGLRIVLACLALGVAAIATVGGLRAAIEAGIAADGRAILGGDLEVQRADQPLPATLRPWLAARGARLSAVVQMRSLLVAPSGQRQLVTLRAVDPAWPLVGQATAVPAQPIAAALVARGGVYGLLAEAVVLDRLSLRVGDTVRVGQASFILRGVLAAEPDRAATPSLLSPHVLIAAAALPATGLVQPGSLVSYALRVVLPPGTDGAAFAQALRAAFAGQGLRLRDARHAVPGVLRFIEQTGLFMTLVGLTALLVGGIGVANGVRAWLEARGRSVAILRCLGGSARLVFLVCLIQVMALALLGVLVGVAAGAVLPLVAGWLLRDVLPVPPRLGLYPAPLLLAAAYGLLTAGCFALWPLARAMRIPGGALFRDAVLPARRWPGRRVLAANALLAALLVALTVVSAPDRRFALWFCGAAVLTLALFRLGGWALLRVAALVPRGGPVWLRLGLANLHRPGSPAPLLLLSLGIGLSTLAAVALIEGNMRRQILEALPSRAPSFYFVDIQNDQLPRFEAILAAQPGVSDVSQVPSLRARIVSVAGVPAERVRASADSAWALRGDRGLTYAAVPPAGTRLLAGRWWAADYRGPPLLSFDADLARGWGVRLGDIITMNVLGRDIDLRVANLRVIDWRSLSLNFAMVVSPGLFSHAPHMHIATVRVVAGRQGAVLRAVSDALPNVTGILVADVLRAIAGVLGQISAALGVTGAVTLAAGALVLAGTVLAGQRRRMQEAVILKTLGATRGQILGAWLVEFGLLGGVAGVIAAVVGALAAFSVMHFLLASPFALLPGLLALILFAAMALTWLFGYAALASVLRAKAAPLLRNE